MSRSTAEAFAEVVEWCAEQPWSSGKVGLLGISYYAGTQWRIGARNPKGLACMIPWEGMSDYYRDRCRHGGILSNQFIAFWWNRQVVSNQYGKPGRKAANWGIDTIEGDLSLEELEANRQDQTIDNVKNRFRDEEYYASKDFRLEDIKVPLLSVANWGGILLHLRGNVQGYMHAGSDLKYLRFITGRHDLPFYYSEEVELQRTFLDAFLKGKDEVGWSEKGKLAPVSVVLRKGDVGFNDAKAEKAYPRRDELEWPIARTQYTKYFLSPELGLSESAPQSEAEERLVSYKTLGKLDDPQLVQFTTPPFEGETEITGHVVARLCVSASKATGSDMTPSDIDIFVTLRHLSSEGAEIHYTGTAGDPVPLTKGWLRVSLRKVEDSHPYHREWLPHREYRSTDVQDVKPNTVYEIDVELWPTNVVVEKGGRLVFEVASGDTQGEYSVIAALGKRMLTTVIQGAASLGTSQMQIGRRRYLLVSTTSISAKGARTSSRCLSYQQRARESSLDIQGSVLARFRNGSHSIEYILARRPDHVGASNQCPSYAVGWIRHSGCSHRRRTISSSSGIPS